MSTPELVGIVARSAGVDERDVGYAGLKDKHAITSQWLSLPARASAPESWELPANVRILQASRHVNKLRTGQPRREPLRHHVGRRRSERARARERDL
jgi:tRNA pseudouridine13 synthase